MPAFLLPASATMFGFFYGVIEGFYGRQWSWQARADYAAFLKQFGFDCYIYAPKGDSYLRSDWRQRHPEEEWEKLQRLSAHYHLAGLRWGLGISPLGLSESYSHNDKSELQSKVKQISTLSPDILCILFDDVRGDIEGIAERQLEIVGDILAVSTAARHIVCPTYYSFDPVLEQVFGPMPEGYLAMLGAGLPAEVGVFWTGNQVISQQYNQPDLAKITAMLQRAPVLWDNYPVNDGRLTSQYLHLAPYSGRSGALAQWTAGHVVNPMNQPSLSQFVLQTLAAVYAVRAYSVDDVLEQSFAWLGDDQLAEQLATDMHSFQFEGLQSLDVQVKTQLFETYSRFNHPVADEIAAWLAGEYTFDPACLTG
ncbi:beta-N-acetylglucosaminidase domain-containing protein [Oceanicoccus sp. KOV_DT_Chl]|uniref:beta-N-acetylglucosaminidase domain-containing protein n=1 Tax=Oceanicoccus sp. KOV_DT_Chl TaxID=1904639 RepID=UPI000C7CD95D|nr:beta-N-acetylglucosaminidase domain-containing protein [Oceanicoccus sp. KOV_DT_Chl]